MTVAGVWALYAAASAISAQPNLRIASPADLTVVNPGDSIKVIVETSGKVTDMAILGCDAVGVTTMLSVPPYE